MIANYILKTIQLRMLSRLFVASVCLCAVLAQTSAETLAALEFRRDAIVEGEVWRLFTGQLVHYGSLHMATDTGVFLALCWMALRRRLNVIPIVSIVAFVVGLTVYCAGNATACRGMSGIDCGLFGCVIVNMAVQDRRWPAILCTGLLAAALFRFCFEVGTGRCLLPSTLPAGVAVAGLAHLFGLLTGCFIALGSGLLSRKEPFTLLFYQK